MRKVVLSWSGGKDSLMAFKRLQDDPQVEVCGLITAFTGQQEVVNLHYIPKSLIQKQAEALNLSLYPIHLSNQAPNEEYERKHGELFDQLKANGIHEVAFGDIHLEPIREYRDRLLTAYSMSGNYPLWHEKPLDLVNEFLDHGFKAVITSIDSLQVPDQVLNQTLSRTVIRTLEASNLDPCGENGEYHTFVCNGPAFKDPIEISLGETFEKNFRPQIQMHLKVSTLQ